VAPPFRRTELDLMFGKGISATGSLLDCAVKYDIIKKSGAWYSYNEEKVGQGRDNAREYLEQHPDFARDLDVKLRQIIFPGREFPAAKAAASKPAAEAAKPSAGAASKPAAAGSSAADTAAASAAAPVAAAASATAAKPAAARPAGASIAEAAGTDGETAPKAGPGRPRKNAVSGSDDGLF
jgi:recombination protein RecA